MQGLIVRTISKLLPATHHTLFPRVVENYIPGSSSVFLLKQPTSTHTMLFSFYPVIFFTTLLEKTQVRSLAWKILEKGMATHSSVLAWKIP